MADKSKRIVTPSRESETCYYWTLSTSQLTLCPIFLDTFLLLFSIPWTHCPWNNKLTLDFVRYILEKLSNSHWTMCPIVIGQCIKSSLFIYLIYLGHIVHWILNWPIFVEIYWTIWILSNIYWTMSPIAIGECVQ